MVFMHVDSKAGKDKKPGSWGQFAMPDIDKNWRKRDHHFWGWSEDMAWKRAFIERRGIWSGVWGVRRSKEIIWKEKKTVLIWLEGVKQKQIVNFHIHLQICQRRVFSTNAMDSALLDYNSGMTPCPIIHLWEKLFLRVTVKGCCHLPIHFIITLSNLFNFLIEQTDNNTATLKCTHTTLLTLIIVSRSGIACVGGRWGEMWPGVVPSVGDSLSVI